MDGITAEFELFTDAFARPSYAVGRPGGEAANLVDRSVGELRTQLRSSGAYPFLWSVLNDLEQQGGTVREKLREEFAL